MSEIEDRQALRRQAEELVRKGPATIGALSAEEVHRLLHELEVHKAELETQNEELRQAQHALELVRDAYADLYDHAPVGYFSIAASGLIRRVNLTGAALLGMDRNALLNQRFTRFIAPQGVDAYFEHRRQTFARLTSESCEIPMRRSRWHALLRLPGVPRHRRCRRSFAEYRSTITDIS